MPHMLQPRSRSTRISGADGSFGEGGRAPQPGAVARALRLVTGRSEGSVVDSQLGMPSSRILYEGVTCGDHLGRRVGLGTPHRPQLGFEPTVLGLATVVGVRGGVMERLRCQLFDHRRIAGRLVYGYLDRACRPVPATGDVAGGPRTSWR